MLARGRPACHIQSMGRAKRPRDTNKLAKLVVDVATGEVDDKGPEKAEGQRKGGLKGGPARAKALTPKQRQTIARKAAAARWEKV